VAAGTLSDCQGLAAFASTMAGLYGNSDNAAFVQSFGVLVPQISATQIGGIPSNTNAVYLNTGQASGYQSIYQNTTPDNPSTGWNGDQGHHFAAFFEFGFQYGGSLGAITSAVYEWAQAFGGSSGLNMGDIQLGITAAEMGAGLKAGTISAANIGNLINATVCQH
jgi:hypothetical protein